MGGWKLEDTGPDFFTFFFITTGCEGQTGRSLGIVKGKGVGV